MRRGAGISEVAQTTTLRFMPSALSSFSINSRTSRLRSPISAMTLTSAELCRAMAPNNVLFPTPEPPKIPMRCPFPNGSRLSMARTPVTSGSVMCSRSQRPRRRGIKIVKSFGINRGPAVHRFAEAVEHAPQQLRAHFDARRFRAARPPYRPVAIRRFLRAASAALCRP